MKAVKIPAPEQMQVVEIEKPSLKAGEVLVKLSHVGFCGSDLNTFLGRNPMVKMPVIPGHEIGAVIAEVGEEVPETLKPGMVVTINPYTNCEKCPSCLHHRPNACEHNETLGVQRNGAMCEYIAVPWTKVIPAEGISPRDCALIIPCRQPRASNRYRHRNGDRLWHDRRGSHRACFSARGNGYRSGLG